MKLVSKLIFQTLIWQKLAFKKVIDPQLANKRRILDALLLPSHALSFGHYVKNGKLMAEYQLCLANKQTSNEKDV